MKTNQRFLSHEDNSWTFTVNFFLCTPVCLCSAGNRRA